MIPQFIIPSNLRLKANAICIKAGVLTIDVSVQQSKSSCPICKKKSSRVHSKYKRTLTDLPVSGYVAKIELIARRYFCDNPICYRMVFTERFENEIKPYNRRLLRSNDLLTRLALELGGNNGAKISRIVGIPVSSSTVLRIIKQHEIKPQTITSGIIGVDDWAFKKGNNYGTVIVDLERKAVVDLLPDRQAETLTEWLKVHPEIKVVSRDRYGPYALGIQNGAPQAIQVADRFHLLMNLGEATKRILQTKSKELKESFNQYNNSESKKDPDPDLFSEENKQHPSGNNNLIRQYKFEKVKELHAANYSLKAIARQLKMNRQTIKLYIAMKDLTKREIVMSTNFNNYLALLQHQDNKGKTYKELFLLVVGMGFNGKYAQFCFNMNQLLNIKPGIITRNIDKSISSSVKTWTTTRLSMMLYMETEALAHKDNDEFLKFLYWKCPEIKQLELLVKKFKNMFIEKSDGLLTAWIDEASNPDSPLKNFAKNLSKDFQAVNNAVITPYSNGQLEGQVNRIKNIKRKMYGKAGFQLLRKMVLAKSG